MIIRDAINQLTRDFALVSDSPRLDAELIMARVRRTDRMALLKNSDRLLTPRQSTRLQRLARQRQHHVPVAYLTGQQNFFGLPLRVTPAVLIPRPATELLVEHVIHHWPNRSRLKIIDVGTGSGAIALALASYFPQAKISAIDISPAALAVARANAKRLKLSAHITWQVGSLLSTIRRDHYQVIIANLPYLRPDQLTEPSLLAEPPVALAGGRMGLSLIKIFLNQLTNWSFDEVVLEIDPRQAKTVAAWLQQRWPLGQLTSLSDGRSVRGLAWRKPAVLK